MYVSESPTNAHVVAGGGPPDIKATTGLGLPVDVVAEARMITAQGSLEPPRYGTTCTGGSGGV